MLSYRIYSRVSNVLKSRKCHSRSYLLRSVSTQQHSPERVSSTPFDTSTDSKVVKVSDGVFQSRSGCWQVVVGLEVHAQIRSASKLFSVASTLFGMNPNSQVSLVDAAVPGTLPVLNAHCVDQAIRTGLALKGKVNTWSMFDRKHYFYCDLPHGYQITQQQKPIIEGGELTLNMPDLSTKTIQLQRIQLEIDSGKSLHDQHPLHSYVDLNRAGHALLELVTEPQLKSANEAALFVKTLQLLLRQLGTCDGTMEDGSLRADANVSLEYLEQGHVPDHVLQSTARGVRCEIKNLNSVRHLTRAIEYEVTRQIAEIERGNVITKQTRFFDPIRKVTVMGRSKEDEKDYRFFPEPDLPPLVLEPARIAALGESLPILPDEIRRRLMTECALSAYDAQVLSTHIGAYEYLRDTTRYTHCSPADIARWIINDLFALLHARQVEISASPVTPARFAELLTLIDQHVITAKIAREVLSAMMSGDSRSARAIIDTSGQQQIDDHAHLLQLCRDVLRDSPVEVAEYKKGKSRVMKHFVGHVMKMTRGRANGPIVTQLFEQLLHEQSEAQSQDHK